MAKDYIPRPNDEFNGWFLNLVVYVKTKTTGANAEWRHIPAEEIELLEGVHEAWVYAYEPTLGPRNDALIQTRNDTRREAEAIIRPFVQRYLMWPPVTDTDRRSMRLTVRDKTRTDHREVPQMVAATLEPGPVRQVILNFKIEGADHRAKPEGYDGAVIIYAVGPTAFTRVEDLRDGHEIASRTPHTLHFTDEQRGQIVSVCLCWQNERGTRGAWSQILSTVIP